ncbi:hypothetical protein [Pseudorhodoplanes sp.]|uniref:hypothetical protein n=1 Tax=Pseudorhodoplanes sp. TaxID=1934341 RepID=UPI00391915CE
MKVLIVLLLTLCVAPAAAHTSLVPHEHPHAFGMLPDLLLFALAALLVGLGFAALRRAKKG